jgi:hypothetical protein
MSYYTDPARADVVERSRQLADGEQLDPPGEMPALFTCSYGGQPAVGAVFRNGAVCIWPDHVEPSLGPCAYTNMRAVEQSEAVTDVLWQWGVSRLLDVS